MKQAKFPEGWDEKRVKAVIVHYESQNEDEVVAEDEAGVEPSETPECKQDITGAAGIRPAAASRFSNRLHFPRNRNLLTGHS